MAGSASGGDDNPSSSDTTLTSIFQVPLVPNNLARPPVLWTSDEVKTWVGFCIQEFSLPHICLDKFNINGKALLILTKADFLERAPEAGDVLYNVFQHLSQSKGSSLTYNYHGCVKGPVFLSPVKEFSSLKDSRGRTPSQHTSTSFVPILPHPSPSGVVSKEDNPSSLQDVPASMLSPAPTEKYSSDSDSCPNDAGFSTPSVDMDIDYQTPKPDDHHLYLNCQAISHNPAINHPESSEGRLLWEFIYQLLEDKKYKDVLSWESESNLIFCIKNSNRLAELWGSQKNRTNMTYEKLSRALRYYYKMGIIRKVPGKKLTYQFLKHPKQIRRGQRGARPHSQRTHVCDEDKALDTGSISNDCPDFPTKSPSANPSNLSKTRSLSPASPLSLSDRSSPIWPVDKEAFTHNDCPIMSRILDAGLGSKIGATMSDMNSSRSPKIKVDENTNKQQGKEPCLPLQSLGKECKTRERPLSCPLDHSYHSHKIFSSYLNDRPPFKKPLSQPVSPRYHSNISGHISVTSLSSEIEPFICKELEDREALFKTMSHIKCSVKPEEAAVEVDHKHAMSSSFVNDSNKTQHHLSFYNDHSSPHGTRIEHNYNTSSPTDQRHFNSPVQETPDKVNFLDRQIQYISSSSGFSSYNQSLNRGKMLHCNSTTLSADAPNIHNIHKTFKESSVPVSGRLYHNNLQHFSSNCTSHISRLSHKSMQPLEGVPSTYMTSLPEPHDHLYHPYPVHNRIPINILQQDSQSHGLKPVIQNLAESRNSNGSQSLGNGHYRPLVTPECSIKTFKPDTNFLLSHSGQSNNHASPVMKDESNYISSNDHSRNYAMHYNAFSVSFPQDSSIKMNLPHTDINRSLDYQPDCSSNNNVCVKFQDYRTEQEQPEDLSISVKT